MNMTFRSSQSIQVKVVNLAIFFDKGGSKGAALDSSAPIVIYLARLTLYRMLTPLYYREKVKVA